MEHCEEDYKLKITNIWNNYELCILNYKLQVPCSGKLHA